MKNLKLITLTSLLAIGILANCYKREIGGNQANGAILGQLVGGLGKGNCAISLNLNSLYAGAVYAAAINNSTTTFTEAQYVAASGTTLAAQGFSSISTVPYNRKYDAFVNPASGQTTFTTTTRDASLATAKKNVDAGAYLGVAAAVCSASPSATNAVIAAKLSAFRTGTSAILTTTEATDVNTVLTSAGIAGGTTTFEAAITCPVASSPFSAAYTAFGGATQTASMYLAKVASVKGGAILACSRIPKASCSLDGISTKTRSAAISSQAAIFETVMSTPDCRKPEAAFDSKFAKSLYVGLSNGAKVNLTSISGGIYTADGSNEGSTSSYSANNILPEQSYPVSTALMAISSNFANAFPLATGTTAYNSTTWRGGSNVNFVSADSCEGLGLLPAVNPAPAAATAKYLTDAKEIAYAFSTNGLAASAYYTYMGTNSASTATNDGIACNRALRKKFSVPSVLGGGTLADLGTVSGDGGATGLVTTCVYGGDSTNRGTIVSLLSSTLSGIAECPTAAQTGSSLFGDTGVKSWNTYPNAQ